MPQELLDTLEKHLPDDYTAARDNEGRCNIKDRFGSTAQTIDTIAYGDITKRLQNMDIAGIDVALLSAGCYPTWMTMTAARMFNDAGADLMRKHGGRLRPMIHIPAWGEEGIIEEVERAAKLGLVGLGITTNYHGKYPDEDEYMPLFKKAADLGLPVFIHAAGGPVHTDDLRKYNLTRNLGRALDHTLVAVRMLYSGLLAGLPNLKVVSNYISAARSSRRRAVTSRFIPTLSSPRAGTRSCSTRCSSIPHLPSGGARSRSSARCIRWERTASRSAAIIRRTRCGPTPRSCCEEAMANVRDANFTEEEKRLILGENARAFYRLPELAKA